MDRRHRRVPTADGGVDDDGGGGFKEAIDRDLRSPVAGNTFSSNRNSRRNGGDRRRGMDAAATAGRGCSLCGVRRSLTGTCADEECEATFCDKCETSLPECSNCLMPHCEGHGDAPDTSCLLACRGEPGCREGICRLCKGSSCGCEVCDATVCRRCSKVCRQCRTVSCPDCSESIWIPTSCEGCNADACLVCLMRMRPCDQCGQAVSVRRLREAMASRTGFLETWSSASTPRLPGDAHGKRAEVARRWAALLARAEVDASAAAGAAAPAGGADAGFDNTGAGAAAAAVVGGASAAGAGAALCAAGGGVAGAGSARAVAGAGAASFGSGRAVTGSVSASSSTRDAAAAAAASAAAAAAAAAALRSPLQQQQQQRKQPSPPAPQPPPLPTLSPPPPPPISVSSLSPEAQRRPPAEEETKGATPSERGGHHHTNPDNSEDNPGAASRQGMEVTSSAIPARRTQADEEEEEAIAEARRVVADVQEATAGALRAAASHDAEMRARREDARGDCGSLVAAPTRRTGAEGAQDTAGLAAGGEVAVASRPEVGVPASDLVAEAIRKLEKANVAFKAMIKRLIDEMAARGRAGERVSFPEDLLTSFSAAERDGQGALAQLKRYLQSSLDNEPAISCGSSGEEKEEAPAG
ncbi:unnamed protein product, partial [Scytosiphon promiscuus]